MFKTLRFFMAPYQPSLIFLIVFVVGLVVPRFVDSDSAAIGMSTGMFVGLMLALRFNNNESTSFPIMYGSKIAFSLPISKRTILLGWYSSMVMTTLVVFASFISGHLLGTAVIENTIAIEPVIGWLHMIFVCIIYLNLSSRFSLFEPKTKKRERLEWLYLGLIFLFSMLYNVVFMSLHANSKPYTWMLPITAFIFIATTIIAIRKLWHCAQDIEVI